LKSRNPILLAYDYIEEGLCILSLVIMTVMNFANILSRYVLHSSISFTEEITITGFVWCSMIGAAVAYKRGAHMNMSFIQDRFSKKNQVWFVLFATICSVVFLAILIYYGFDMVNKQIMLNSKTPSLQMPTPVQSLSIPIGAILMLLRALEYGIKTCIEYRKEGEAK